MSVKVTPREVTYRGTGLVVNESSMSPDEAFKAFLSLLNEAIDHEDIEGRRDSRRSPYMLHELHDIRDELLTIFWSGCGSVTPTAAQMSQ